MQMTNLKLTAECHTATKHLQGNADVSMSETLTLTLSSVSK